MLGIFLITKQYRLFVKAKCIEKHSLWVVEAFL
jgi:hypothetical protein